MIDWLVQNFIQNIPVYVWAFVAGAGLGLYVISGLAGRFDAIKPYAVLVRGASMLLLVGGAFMAGGAGVTAAWQERIKLKQQVHNLSKNLEFNSNYQIACTLLHDTCHFICARCLAIRLICHRNDGALCRLANHEQPARVRRSHVRRKRSEVGLHCWPAIYSH